MKILIHAINGVGLGHLVRTVQVAKAIRDIRGDLEIVFVTNSEFPGFITKSSFNFHKLKISTKDVLDQKISYEDYLKYNNLHLKKIIEKENPNMILFDSELNESLMDFCIKKKIKISFILREKTKDKFYHLIRSGMLKMIDLVLIPHHKWDLDKECVGELQGYNNVFFVGPIIKTTSNSNIFTQKSSDFFKILVTFSGGANIIENREMFNKVSDFLGYLKSNDLRIKGRLVKLNLIVGPFFDKNSCNLHGLEYSSFEYDLMNKMRESDIIISSAGYNIINEIIYTKTPSLLIPLPRKEDDQFARAEKLERMGCAKIVRGSIQEALETTIENNLVEKMKDNFPKLSLGNGMAAKLILTHLEDNIRVAIFRSNWLPLTERCIFDELDILESYEPVIFCLHKDSNFQVKFKLFHKKIFEPLWSKDFPFIKNRDIKLYNKFIRWCSEIITLSNIKVLHAQFLTDGLFFLKIKKLTKLPLIVSVRGFDIYSLRKINLTPLFSQADLFLVRSHTMKKDLIGLGCDCDKIVVHHSGIILPIELRREVAPLNNIKILMVGRLTEKKGTSFGIETFNGLCRYNNNLALCIIGDGPLRNQVTKKVSESPFSHKIKLLGEVTNQEVLEVMGGSQILLQPSKTARDGDKEGIPNSIMEAMSLGLIVVASDNGSIPEIVENKKTGFIFKENNFEEAINQLRFVIENISELNELKINAFVKVKNEFNIRLQDTKLERIYKKLIECANQGQVSSTNNISPPQSAKIRLTKKCNFKCVMCGHWKEKETSLPKENIIKVLNELRELGVRRIQLTGGEPTLRDDFVSIVKEAVSLNFNVSLSSNLSWLGGDILTLFRNKSIGDLTFSFHSANHDINDAIVGQNGATSKIKSNLNILRKLDNPPNLTLNCVVLNQNYNSLIEVVEYAKSMEIGCLRFSQLELFYDEHSALQLNRDQLTKYYWDIVPEIVKISKNLGLKVEFRPTLPFRPDSPNYKKSINWLIDNHSEKKYGLGYPTKTCISPQVMTEIRSDGGVYPCCNAKRSKDLLMGNIKHQSFSEIWNLSKYREFRNNTSNMKHEVCINCKDGLMR